MNEKLKTAISEIKSGNMKSALRILNEIIYKDVRCFGAYIYRGKVKRKLYDFQGALEDYNAAVRLNPERAEGYNNRAKLYYSVCSFKKAFEDIKKANELCYDSALILFNKGKIEYKLNMFKDALDSYSSAIRIDAFFLPAYLERGLLKEKNGDYKGAKNDYLSAICLNKKCARAYNYLERICVTINDGKQDEKTEYEKTEILKIAQNEYKSELINC
jgi:tetratricopeptide (TPR) repeat protein